MSHPREGTAAGDGARPAAPVPARASAEVQGHEAVLAPLLPKDAEGACAVLFALHYTELVCLARHLLDQPADGEDVVMDAFAGLELRWHRMRRHDDAFFYLRASVVNGTRSRLRRLRLARSKLHTQLQRDAAPADEAALQHLERDVVREAVRALARRQREVLVLRYYAGATEAEIAEILGISLGSVKTHASRGLRTLASVVEASA